jgi:3-oxoacyl-[acyl-carrier protein] reductase
MSSSKQLEGKVALVTGAGQGIGREVAQAFSAAGAHVVVADLDEANARQVADALVKTGASAASVAVDVADEASVARMIDAAQAEFGRVDALVNAAAIFSTLTMKPFEEIDGQEWRKVLDVNITGTFLCCQAVAAIMRSQEAGSIINISSATVLGGRPGYLHYVTSKAAIVGMTRSLARELGASGITVNVIMPGSVETGIPRDSARPDSVTEIVGNQAIKRRMVSADLVGAALFLASDAAQMMTGQTMVVDGGMNFL